MKRMAKLAGLATCGLVLACTPTALLNVSAPTSTFIGPVGQIVPRPLQVVFINNTGFRAIFTFGSYDQLNEETSPTGFGQLRLEANTTSTQQTQPCRKTFSVGGEELKRLIEVRDLDVTDPRALVDGVNFSGAPLGDPLEAEPTEGTAQGLVARAGVDFDCESLLIFRLEQDAMAPGGFRIDLDVVTP
jgi:hypothetical protein